MAIERSSKKKYASSKSKRSTGSAGFKVLIAILIILPIAFYFIDPGSRSSFMGYQTARAYERFGNHSEAKKYYGKAYESSKKKNLRAQVKYAEMCNKMGQFTEAINVTTKLIGSNPLDEILLAEIYHQQGLGFEGNDSTEEALVAFIRGAKLDTGNYHLLVSLGRVYRIRGELLNSKRYLEQAINLRQLRAPEAHFELGMTYLAENNKADALDEFDYVLSQLPPRDLKNKAQQKKIDIMADR